VGDHLALTRARAALAPAAAEDQTDYTNRQVATLVQRLFVAGTAASKVVVFSAIEPRSGCSWVCARIAETLASGGQASVCLVDATLRPGPVSGQTRRDTAPDAVDDEWLMTPVQHPAPAAERDLWFLSYTSAAASWQTPTSLTRFQERLSELRKTFDYVLVDAPSIGVCGDAVLLGRMADGFVMVLEANRTRRDAAVRAQRTLEAAGVRIAGAVLNRRGFPIPEWLYQRI